MRSLQANRWRCVFGLSEARPCPRRYPNCRPFNGPDVHVWRRNDTPCSEVVIAYRGLNLRNPADWPNFHWLFKLSRSGDAAQIDGILAASGCRAAGRVIAAGHSLGGGYAEDGAYAHRRVRYVYAFNAVPVASLDLDPDIAIARGLASIWSTRWAIFSRCCGCCGRRRLATRASASCASTSFLSDCRSSRTASTP
jgi:hypothetical protein